MKKFCYINNLKCERSPRVGRAAVAYALSQIKHETRESIVSIAYYTRQATKALINSLLKNN